MQGTATSTGASSPAPIDRRHEIENPLWYRDAVVYQLHVRGFFDSNDDGIGDFRGLTEKLDYIQSLGVTAIWLQPFYPSPLKDDGYDIADYTGVNPSYGTRRDFLAFLNAAHDRGLRVITELVINHTSDQHPWFQAARRARRGTSKRNFYVWSDTDQKYAGVPIVFKDTERSNWTWDPVAGQYYWHRFFFHQPDLNFDNPMVLKAVLRVMRFWLDMGVDGMRLDAVPYLVEREGTQCANLPETHAILKAIRRELDARHPGRMLLAEANQWPSDVRAYFGDGDECHMAFHFPLMPRLYTALRQEDRHPISEILEAERAVRQFPLLAQANVVRTWSAIRVMTQDGFPIYDESQTHPGAFTVCCHSGVTLAANHALTIAPMIARGALDKSLVAPFSARRFHVQEAG